MIKFNDKIEGCDSEDFKCTSIFEGRFLADERDCDNYDSRHTNFPIHILTDLGCHIQVKFIQRPQHRVNISGILYACDEDQYERHAALTKEIEELSDVILDRG